jgi:FdhD protein
MAKMSITKVIDSDVKQVEDELIRETRVALVLDGHSMVQTVCSPGQYDELAYGYLLSRGLIRSIEDVASIDVVDLQGTVSVAVRSLNSQVEPDVPLQNDLAIPLRFVQETVQRLHDESRLFHATGGTHTVSISSLDGVHVLAEDISRTCALEKTLGIALMDGVDLERCMISLSSRIPRGFVDKVAHARIPIIAAVSAPTYEAVQEAERLGICLCGFVRNGRLNAYSHAWRVGL